MHRVSTSELRFGSGRLAENQAAMLSAQEKNKFAYQIFGCSGNNM
jgi:hypothetical protein